MSAAFDRACMDAASTLARRSLGTTWPNPAVGCVIAKDGRILARGRTQPGGRPHGEADAIAQARAAGLGAALAGATAYVTLEPCSHHGKTPPCAEALVEAGIARTVSAIEDPDSRVSGRGHERLRAAGVAVEVGLGAAEAAEINEGFFRRVRDGRPLVHLKLATSLDGRIAARGGDSKWITGPAARQAGHLLRASHDAILVGISTVLADDPELTCRLPGMETRSPVRIVLDSALRLPHGARLVATAHQAPVWVLAGEPADVQREAALQRRNVNVSFLARDGEGRVDMAAALRRLGDRGITRLLVEGGASVAAALLREDLVDRISVFRAGLVVGGDGLPAVGAIGVQKVASAPRFTLASRREIDGDVLETWARAA